MIPYTVPKAEGGGHHCPHCQTYAHHVRLDLCRHIHASFEPIVEPGITQCSCCQGYLVWCNDTLMYPRTGGAPSPNPDLPESIRADYAEAGDIVGRSPRGAAALLRLVIQELCIHLGEKGKKINDDIASLVSKGLPVETKEALDIVRVIGNNAVHPGEWDMRDDQSTALALFDLVNSIAEDMITRPGKRKELYNKLPQGALDGIAKRDAKAAKASSGA